MAEIIHVNINDRPVIEALRQLQLQGANLRPAMRAITGVMADASERAFRDERDPATLRAWAPLSPVTQARKVAKKGRKAVLRGAHPILQVSGQLAASLSRDYGDDYALYGTNKVYAPTQFFGAKRGQFGSTARGSPLPWGTVPGRRYLGLSDDDQAEILDILVRHMGD